MALMTTRFLGKNIFQSVRLLKPQVGLARVQTAFISGRNMRDRTYKKPPPFPYKEKRLSRLLGWFQNPLKWFDDNTKLIIVEGSIAAGKSSFAKELATELEMLYLPEVTMDNFYVNDYGYDFRDADPELPPAVRSYDIKNYYENPKDRRAAIFQMLMFELRFAQYIDALAHMFNTGQGVILERCAYSDVVFMETMLKRKYLSKPMGEYYHEVRRNTLSELMKPHLVIYLDAPPDVLLERIKKRNIPYEANSSVINKEYLQILEKEYKNYLKQISTHAELLFYDWSKFGEVELVVEDIERIDFDKYDKYDAKMRDWLMFDYWDWVEKRYIYTSRKQYLLSFFHNIPFFHLPELVMDTNDAREFWYMYNNAPGKQYAKGYNADCGDKNILFKGKSAAREIF